MKDISFLKDELEVLDKYFDILIRGNNKQMDKFLEPAGRKLQMENTIKRILAEINQSTEINNGKL